MTVSLCLSLLDILFVRYLEMEIHAVELEICVVDTESMKDLTRAMFLFLYAGPVLAVSFLLIQVSSYITVRSDDLKYPWNERNCDSLAIHYFRLFQDEVTRGTKGVRYVVCEH